MELGLDLDALSENRRRLDSGNEQTRSSAAPVEEFERFERLKKVILEVKNQT